ncbi:uncharacterized protein LOC135332311 [Halichondria panicea]|uniref:uncharacterized protein LOC135332311 n=1 Tax=Halichondria panicea TaxID=6063 RepID=UPI00312B8FBC
MATVTINGVSFPLEAIYIVGALCGLIVIFLFFISCLSCILCALPRRSESPRDKTEPLVLKWADTEPGNVELLAMRTLSETILEPATTTADETKSENSDEEVTAGTFGFQGEIVKNQEIVTVECNDEDTDTKQQVEESQPATSTFGVLSDKQPLGSVQKPDLVLSTPVVIVLEEATPTKPPSDDKPTLDEHTTLMSDTIEPHEPIVDTAKPTAANKSTEEITSNSTAADTGKSLEQPNSPNILFMDDIDKALGMSPLDMQLMDIPGTSL